ncbi:glycosyltransferase [Planctomicrobium sp. SH527]|uniref:glycosyltransferase n=1 Tax=Planctomicrobium sp. SH527 TaxID=3448123 RepID=UPI003F5AFDC6
MITSRLRACALQAAAGELHEARSSLRTLLEEDSESDAAPARSIILTNLAAIEAALGNSRSARQLLSQIPPHDRSPVVTHNTKTLKKHSEHADSTLGSSACARGRVSLVSFLFNWPSTGGGIVHTVELAKFLSQAGYEVQLVHPVLPEWGIGQVDHTCPVPTIPLAFSLSDWSIPEIQHRFREAIECFSPDQIIITDCWNFKPYLAQAFQGYSYLMRMQASECLCPLNNLRLLPDSPAHYRQCHFSQPATPQHCRSCLFDHGHSSGSLHQAERQLSQVESDDYYPLLLKAMAEATSVLVLNQSTRRLWEPYCRDVRVVTWGMDASRFPDPVAPPLRAKMRLLFAGLPQEPIKGFSVLREACRRLWMTRQDFELLVTASPDQLPTTDPFISAIGWQSQETLPNWYRECDLVVVPAIAQEALSRTAVEGMASARPVLGSNLGGLPEILEEGITGRLAEPGVVEDWVRQLTWFLDHPAERRAMGLQGRRQFEDRFTWERVIEDLYMPLLTSGVAHSR